MAQFTKHNCSPTVREIEDAIEEDGGCLMGFGGSFCCPGECPPKVGDWEIRLVDRRGCGNQGLFIAIATTPETYAAQMAATVRVLRRMADETEKKNPEFLRANRGDIGRRVLPVRFSALCETRGYLLTEDEKWKYFVIAHGNYLRVGDDRDRIWVRRKDEHRPVVRSAKRVIRN